MTKNEALRMGMDALVSVLANHKGAPVVPWNDALDAMEIALEVKDEPVAFASHGVVNWIADKQFQHEADLYTTPQQRTWVGLTDEEREQVINANTSTGLWHMAKDIEAKLKGKNGA